MQVPLLQYAQMPIIKPASEMEGFSNALLNAGRMMVDRRTQEMARKAAAEQQKFQNKQSTAQLGIQQEQLGLAKQQGKREDTRLGMAKQQDKREAQAFDMDMAAKQRQVAREKRDAQVMQILSQPEHAQAMQSRDMEGQLDYVRDLSMQLGAFDEQDQGEYLANKMKVLQFKQESEVNDLKKMQIQGSIRATNLDMQLAKAKAAAAQSGGGMDMEAMIKQAQGWGKLKDDSIGMVKDARDKAFSLQRTQALISDAKDLSQVESALAASGVKDTEIQTIMKQAAAMSGDDPRKVALLRGEVSKRLQNLADEQLQGIGALEQQANEYATKEYSFLSMSAGGRPEVRNIYGLANEQPAANPGQSFGDKLINTVGEAIKVGSAGVKAGIAQKYAGPGSAVMANFKKATDTKEAPVRPSSASAYNTMHSGSAR